MIVFKEAGSVGSTQSTFVQVIPDTGWYEDFQLVTSYATNGSNVWTWTAPSKGLIYLSGCSGGGGGGAGSNNGASAGAGGSGGASGNCLLNLRFPIAAGQSLKITLGAKGTGGVAGGASATAGGATIIEHSGLAQGQSLTQDGGTIGNNARWYIIGGTHGNAASGGTGGTAPGNGMQAADLAQQYSITAIFRLSGAAGGNAGANGSSGVYNSALSGTSPAYGGAGGAAQDGAGGGGAGRLSLFGPGCTGGAGHAAGNSPSYGYGGSGSGGGGNSAGNSNAGNGGDGSPGYVEFLFYPSS